MEKQLDDKRLRHLALQFRCPFGNEGLKTGERMFETNRHITQLSVEALCPAENDVVLEIGMGVARQAGLILQSAPGVRYWGVEMSTLMLEQALAIHRELVDTGKVAFYFSDGITLSFSDKSCDKIFTVNTLYFWEKPIAYLHEIYRVLADKGVFCLTFASADFMKKLPFSGYGFHLYSVEEVIDIFQQTEFTIRAIRSVVEPNVYHVDGRANREVFFLIAEK